LSEHRRPRLSTFVEIQCQRHKEYFLRSECEKKNSDEKKLFFSKKNRNFREIWADLGPPPKMTIFDHFCVRVSVLTLSQPNYIVFKIPPPDPAKFSELEKIFQKNFYDFS